MILGRICCSGRFAETQGNPNSYYSGFHQEDKGADQRHNDLSQASTKGVHNPAKGSEHYVSRFVERQVDKMHEGSPNVVAFDGRLEEFYAPDEEKEENDDPSSEVHDLSLILCMEHVIDCALQP